MSPDPKPGRPRIRPVTQRGSILWIVTGFLIAVLVPALALAMGTSAASGVVQEAVDSAEPIAAGGNDIAGGTTYLVVGPRETTGECLVTGPDGSSLVIGLEEVFQAGSGTSDVSLGSFAAGSAGRYTVDCDAEGLGLVRSPDLGTWSVLGGPFLAAGFGLVLGFGIAVIGIFSWIRARRRRWDRDPDAD